MEDVRLCAPLGAMMEGGSVSAFVTHFDGRSEENKIGTENSLFPSPKNFGDLKQK